VAGNGHACVWLSNAQWLCPGVCNQSATAVLGRYARMKSMARPRLRPLPALLGAGAIALLSSGCTSTLGLATPCSVWASMDHADQQATIINMVHQDGGPTPSRSDLAHTELSASAYCADPFPNDDTIGGMLDSRPS
jgi:hypothetical protein